MKLRAGRMIYSPSDSLLRYLMNWFHGFVFRIIRYKRFRGWSRFIKFWLRTNMVKISYATIIQNGVYVDFINCKIILHCSSSQSRSRPACSTFDKHYHPRMIQSTDSAQSSGNGFCRNIDYSSLLWPTCTLMELGGSDWCCYRYFHYRHLLRYQISDYGRF